MSSQDTSENMSWFSMNDRIYLESLFEETEDSLFDLEVDDTKSSHDQLGDMIDNMMFHPAQKNLDVLAWINDLICTIDDHEENAETKLEGCESVIIRIVNNIGKTCFSPDIKMKLTKIISDISLYFKSTVRINHPL